MADDTRRSSTEFELGQSETAPSAGGPAGLLERWSPVLLIAAGLAIWEVASRAGWINKLFFPAPTLIARSLLTLAAKGELTENLGATLYRFGVGTAAGGIAGFLAGILLGWLPRFRKILDPLISGAYTIPKLALFPLLLIIFGLGESSRVILIGLAAFFPLLINTTAGVRQINPDYFEVARSYGTSPWLMLRRVVLPGSLPSMLSGLRLAMGAALMVTIAVELVNAKTGLGALIWFSWETLHTEVLYVALLLTALLGIGSHIILEYLSRRMIPWQIEHGDELPTKVITEI